VVAAAQQAAIRHDLVEVRDAIDEALEAEGLQDLVEQRIEERGLRVSIASDDILFALGSTEINRVGRKVIRTVARTLDSFAHPLMVEGHTDDVPLERPDYTNWNLSTDRAVEVLSLMVERHGLPPERVGAVGYGEHRPLNPNSSPDSRARNRRVDIVVLVEETHI
jgi:chemotaxis protein MotB